MTDVTDKAGLLVIGEALVDVIHRDGEPDRVLPGGSPLNVAVGLCRLGLPATLRTQFAADPHGDLIATHLAANGVAIVNDPANSASTSVAEARIRADGSAAYSFQVSWDLPARAHQPDDVAAVHTGSIGALLDPGAAIVRAELERLRGVATISYDPNIRPQLLPDPEEARDRVRRLVAGADIVKASEEDVAWLYPGAPAVRVAQEWLASGPSLVVVTAGAAGAFALTGSGEVHVPAPPTRVTDTVGAGDSFMAGLLVALADRALLGRDRAPALNAIDLGTTREVMNFATACAAMTVSRHGADLPYQHELAGAPAQLLDE